MLSVLLLLAFFFWSNLDLSTSVNLVLAENFTFEDFATELDEETKLEDVALNKEESDSVDDFASDDSWQDVSLELTSTILVD